MDYKYLDEDLLMICSVIHGKTGTGKSLLLAAIIGEANVLEGDVQVPRAPPMHMRGNENASAGNWIIPSAVAYVGQVPWIENTSIKNTVLFGLPYHHERYMQVSQTKDTHMMLSTHSAVYLPLVVFTRANTKFFGF